MTNSISEFLQALQPRNVPEEFTVLQELHGKLQSVYHSPACNDVFKKCNEWLFTYNIAKHGTPANTAQKD